MSNGRILHTMLRVGDLDKSIEFYTNVMGMQLLRKNENKEYEYTLAFVFEYWVVRCNKAIGFNHKFCYS